MNEIASSQETAHQNYQVCQVSARLVRQEPSGKLIEIVKIRDFSIEWGTARPY